MSGEPVFRLELAPLEGYEFRVRFDWQGVPELTLDEPPPLGTQKAPNASRLLAAAIANCLTASLLFCLRKAHAEPKGLKTSVTGRLSRNAQGRLRVGDIEVTIALEDTGETNARLTRCAELFEDYCVVTESVRQGFPVHARVVDGRGTTLYEH